MMAALYDEKKINWKNWEIIIIYNNIWYYVVYTFLTYLSQNTSIYKWYKFKIKIKIK